VNCDVSVSVQLSMSIKYGEAVPWRHRTWALWAWIVLDQ